MREKRHERCHPSAWANQDERDAHVSGQMEAVGGLVEDADGHRVVGAVVVRVKPRAESVL